MQAELHRNDGTDHGLLDIETWTFVSLADNLKQDNGYDCGVCNAQLLSTSNLTLQMYLKVMVCFYVFCLTLGIDMHQYDGQFVGALMDNFRLRVALTLLGGNLFA